MWRIQFVATVFSSITISRIYRFSCASVSVYISWTVFARVQDCYRVSFQDRQGFFSYDEFLSRRNISLTHDFVKFGGDFFDVWNNNYICALWFCRIVSMCSSTTLQSV